MSNGDLKLARAKSYQRSKGFPDYAGPLIRGERHVVSAGDAAYPKAFTYLAKPPGELYAIGNLDALCEGLAVIGARKATPYGLSCASRFARMAAEQGVCIISGGAYGCDSQAHKAALECGGKTAVFLGGGCDQVYPPSNLPLFQQVVDGGGVVVSENEWSYPALPFTFRNRNRLIAALARATLIVEAGYPSGTFSTADEALNAGREVLVVPGSIVSRHSAGSNRLLYQGATPIVDDESFHDALFGLFGCIVPEDSQSINRVALKKLDPLAESLLSCLSAQPMRIDDLLSNDGVWKSGSVDSGALMLHLANLEREGLIARYPDGRFGPVLR